MEIKRCQGNLKPGFKAGDTGECFTYTAGDKVSRDKAKRLAEEQARAIKKSNKRKK